MECQDLRSHALGEAIGIHQNMHAIVENAPGGGVMIQGMEINKLIARGDSKEQIKLTLSERYGPAILALPPASGFSLSAGSAEGSAGGAFHP